MTPNKELAERLRNMIRRNIFGGLLSDKDAKLLHDAAFALEGEREQNSAEREIPSGDASAARVTPSHPVSVEPSPQQAEITMIQPRYNDVYAPVYDSAQQPPAGGEHPNPEQRSNSPVAESQAPSIRDGDTGVAPGREVAVPEGEQCAPMVRKPLQAALRKYLESVSPITAGRELLARVEKDAIRWKALKELAGYWQDGSHTTVTLDQDECTHMCFIKVGKKYYGTDNSSFDAAIDAAIEQQSRRGDGTKT